MTKVTFDFSITPNLGVSEEGGSVVSHPTTLGLTEVSLGKDDILRIGGIPVVLYLHHRQSGVSGDSPLTVADLKADLLSQLVASGSLAQVLFEYPNLLPRQWQPSIQYHSVIFWGTKVETISRSEAYPTLRLVRKNLNTYGLIRSVVNADRCISLRPSAILLAPR